MYFQQCVVFLLTTFGVEIVKYLTTAAFLVVLKLRNCC